MIFSSPVKLQLAESQGNGAAGMNYATGGPSRRYSCRSLSRKPNRRRAKSAGRNGVPARPGLPESTPATVSTTGA